MVETFTGTPLICAMSHCFIFSVSVMCHCSWLFHHQSHKANSMNMPVMLWGLMLFTVFDSRHRPWLWLLELVGGSHVRMEPLKVAKFSQCSSSVGIWLKLLGNAAYVACLPLLCQGFKWLSGKSIWLVFRRSLVNCCWKFWMYALRVNSKHIL